MNQPSTSDGQTGQKKKDHVNHFSYQSKILISEITEEHINYILVESDSDDDVQDVEVFDSDYESFVDMSDESEK